jgi:hypothetical protein
MLRVVIGAIGALCAIAGLLLLLAPPHGGLPLLIIGVLVVLSLFFEGRYRAPQSTTGPWQATGEKFIDPGTGKLVEVDYDPQTGERRYREPGNG